VCARITLTTTGTEIADLFGLSYDRSEEARRQRYNVAPAQAIPVVRVVSGKRELADLKWGLVPHWADNPKADGFVNARAETVAQKPAFRDPFRRRRCLVPADGFFEWKHVGKKKQPYYFRKAGGGLLAYAAVWDTWNGPHGPVETVAVLTVPANELVEPLHDRMPAIVPEGRFAAWLDPKETRADKLLPLLVPYPVEQMECWPVGDRVNATNADEPALLLPVPEPKKSRRIQPTLFDVA
jgi:putative SOS response-associated peptidase YedK